MDVTYRRKADELEVFMPRGGSSVVRIIEVTHHQEERSSPDIEQDTEHRYDEHDDDDGDDDSEDDAASSVFESSLSIVPMKYQYTLPEVGFLFYKLVQLVNKRFDAVSEKMKEKFEKNEKQNEVMRMDKTQVEIDKISINLEQMLTVKVQEEKREMTGEEIILTRTVFSKWRQMSRKENKISALRILKHDLVKEFIQICNLELYEIGREIHG
jgi:hypothetical protein